MAKPQNRLQLSFILLLTTIIFKFVVSQTLPRISYLTYPVSNRQPFFGKTFSLQFLWCSFVWLLAFILVSFAANHFVSASSQNVTNTNRTITALKLETLLVPWDLPILYSVLLWNLLPRNSTHRKYFSQWQKNCFSLLISYHADCRTKGEHQTHLAHHTLDLCSCRRVSMVGLGCRFFVEHRFSASIVASLSPKRWQLRLAERQLRRTVVIWME